MNTRFENGTAQTADELREEIHLMLENGSIETIEEETEDHISYFTGYETRTVHFPECESAARIKNAFIADEIVSKYIDLTAFSKLLYNHIDINALMPLENIVLLYDKYDEEGELVPQRARNTLYDMYGDEYAFEVGESNLGAVWVELSTVIINVSEILKTATELWRAKDVYQPVGMEEWNNKDDVFKDIFISTVCHEFRHLLYECNELVRIGEGTPYSETGHLEEEVEAYGNSEAYRLLQTNSSRTLIDNILSPQKKRTHSIERD